MKRTGAGILSDERGMALVVGLMFILVLATLGSIAYLMTANDLAISSQYRAVKQAYGNARAGMTEARLRMRGSKTDDLFLGDPATGVDENWSAFLCSTTDWSTTDDPYYTSSSKNYFPTAASKENTSKVVNSVQTDIKYFVHLRHKREHDAEVLGHTTTNPHYYDGDGNLGVNPASSPGKVLHYGYGDPTDRTRLCQFTTSSTTSFKPVEIITAFGISQGSIQVLEMEGIMPPGPPIVGGIYSKGNVTGNGSSMVTDGGDECGAGSDLPPIYTLTPAVTNVSGSPLLLGNPPNPVQGTSDIDIQATVDALKDNKDVEYTSDLNGDLVGGPDDFVCVYSDTSNPYNVGGLKLQTVTGYGVLIVEGDLTLGGGFEWNGLIMCTGTLVFNGGGAGINIHGAVLANQTVDINGGVATHYNSCMVAKALSSQSMKLLVLRDMNLF